MDEHQGAVSANVRKGRVIVGVDGSEHARNASRWAVEYARLTGSELRLVAAWHWPAMWGVVPAPAVDFEGDTRAVVVELVDELRKDHPDLRIAFDVVCGPPAQALLDAASDADLLVVGSRGHGSFTGMLIGSVSLHCVQHAPCPVVVVRP